MKGKNIQYHITWRKQIEREWTQSPEDHHQQKKKLVFEKRENLLEELDANWLHHYVSDDTKGISFSEMP